MGAKAEIKKFKTSNGINITCIRTAKFKTASVNIFVHNQLDRATAAQNALLPMVLRRGSKDYPTMQELNKKLESLYGSMFDNGIVKKGEQQILHFYIDGINDNFVQANAKIFDSYLQVINSVVANPLIKEGRFNEEYVRQEKENLAKMIQSRINDKDQYAVERCYELMCKDERFGIHELGSVKDLDGISNEGLVNHYNSIFNSSKINVIVLGDVDDSKLENLERALTLKTNGESRIEKEKVQKEVKETNTYIEKMNVNQAKLTMGFRTNIGPKDPDYHALMAYSSILGGGAHSKLFQNVREKASLAYYVYARLEKFKGLMIVSSAIEANNYDKAREIILKQIEDINNGNITNQEFDTSIKTLETGIRAISDEPLQMVDFFLNQSILETDDDFESTIEKIKQVKRDDVIKAAQKVRLDTVYFMRPKD